MRWLGRLIGRMFRRNESIGDPPLPTGQRRSEILAMRDRAENETDEERRRRLGVKESDNRSSGELPRVTITIERVESPRPQKNA